MTADFPLPHAGHDLAGHIAFVTGASSGLGRRFALALAVSGASVAAAGRRTDRLADLSAEVADLGGVCEPIELDVRDAASIVHAVDAAAERFGLVNVLVNNAGIPDAQRAHKMSLELTDAVLDTNIRGPWLLATEVARRLIDAGEGGRIVNISSMGAFSYGGNGAALYSVTKAAVHRMTEALAVEWARYGINVNAIAPGAFESEMMDGMIDRVGDISDRFPRRRICSPALLDSTLLYLVSPASEAVTGTTVKVDDGQGGR